jgi:hypothetical protein
MTRASARRFVQGGLLCVLVGASVIAWIVTHHAGADIPVRDEVLSFGAFVVAGIGLLVAWVGFRELRLGSASQVIARWVVSPSEWQQYVEACQLRLAMPGALPGAVPLDVSIPAQGIEVLALRKGFRIRDSFHEVGTLGAELLDVRVVDQPVHMLEFNMLYATGKTSSVRLGVRVPLASSNAREIVNRVEAHWLAQEPLQAMTMEQLRGYERTGWLLVGAGLVALIGVVGLFIVINPPGWAAVGPISALAILFAGFFRAVRGRNVRFRKFGR